MDKGLFEMDKLVGFDSNKFSDYIHFLNDITLEKRLILTIKEMSKLQWEFSKTLRDKMSREHVVEEMADVLLAVTCTADMLGISQDELDEVIIEKSHRHGYEFTHTNVIREGGDAK